MIETLVPLRRLGRSDLNVSALGLGCWQFSQAVGLVGRFWPKMQQDNIEAIIKLSLDGGINWFDTAEIYGNGQSEMALAAALNHLGAREEDALIATKWWPLFRTSSSITRTIDQRLHALKGRSIDLYQVHQPFSLSNVRNEMEAMAKLVQDQKIRYVGVSNFNAKQMKESHQVLQEQGLSLVSNQVRYSLLDRRIENNGILETAQELGITIIAYSPLEQGILSGKFHKNSEMIRNLGAPRKYSRLFKPAGLEQTKPLIDLLENKAQSYGVSVSQIALNWLIHYHGDTVLAIPGASKTQHAQENIGTLQFRLSQDDLEEIEKLSSKSARF
jgi:aryl-alcohol dehydrogenase-like predicted oxidoreductase